MRYYYVPPSEIVDNEFSVGEFVLDKELTYLENLRFVDLIKICQKVGVLSRRRGTKQQMISEIKSYIVFEPPEN
jgi:hypothetical protein